MKIEDYMMERREAREAAARAAREYHRAPTIEGLARFRAAERAAANAEADLWAAVRRKEKAGGAPV